MPSANAATPPWGRAATAIRAGACPAPQDAPGAADGAHRRRSSRTTGGRPARECCSPKWNRRTRAAPLGPKVVNSHMGVDLVVTAALNRRLHAVHSDPIVRSARGVEVRHQASQVTALWTTAWRLASRVGVARRRSLHKARRRKADPQVERVENCLRRQAGTVDGWRSQRAACKRGAGQVAWGIAPAHARGAPVSVRRRRAINSVCWCAGHGHRESSPRPCPKPPARAPGSHVKAWHAAALAPLCSGMIVAPRHASHPDCRAPLVQIDAPHLSSFTASADTLFTLALIRRCR